MAESWFQFYARQFVLKALGQIQEGRLTVVSKYKGAPTTQAIFGQQLPDDKSIDVVVDIVNPNAWTRICQAFDLGFSEAYMAQEVECANLKGLFMIYILNRNLIGASGDILSSMTLRTSHWVFRPVNNLALAKMNASFHYNSSNELFTSFLSPDMTYSSALWSGDPKESLKSAQLSKIRNIIDKARILPSHHVLEIGCGWGTLAMEAARTIGCRVTGLTLSTEQKALAEKRIKAAGLEDLITILLCDYRKAPRPEGGYDSIVEVEMLNHVGDDYMNNYFQSISELLKPVGGVMVVQGITMINSLHNNKPGVDTFIDRYIFPGGYLPTVNQLFTLIHAGSKGSLEVETVQNIGPHYIKTLRCWMEKFNENWDAIRADFVQMHTDANPDDIEAFRRKWLYYFIYCEAGFRKRVLGNYVISAVRTPETDIPPNIPL